MEIMYNPGFCNRNGFSSIWLENFVQKVSRRGLVEQEFSYCKIWDNYLIGPEFRNRVEAIVESFVAMKIDLDAEKRATQKIWAKREKQIENVIACWRCY